MSRERKDSSWDRASEPRRREGKTLRLDEDAGRAEPASSARPGPDVDAGHPGGSGRDFWRDMERRRREGRTVRLEDEEETQPIQSDSVTFLEGERR